MQTKALATQFTICLPMTWPPLPFVKGHETPEQQLPVLRHKKTAIKRTQIILRLCSTCGIPGRITAGQRSHFMTHTSSQSMCHRLELNRIVKEQK